MATKIRIPWVKPKKRLGDIVPAMLEPMEVVLSVPIVDKLNNYIKSKADKMPAGLKSKLKDLIEMVPASSTMRNGGQVNKIQKVMHEFKTGKLKSSSGQKVKSRKQAIAIALSEQRAVMKKKK
jgi:hypothetical protein